AKERERFELTEAQYRFIPIELTIGKLTWEIDYCVRHGEARVTKKGGD
ncbi:hypothetical protein LCGC14_3091660, partial [marine sediment metagenome]